MAEAAVLTRRSAARWRAPWLLAAAVVGLQIAYPLVQGDARDVLTVVTVVTFFAASVGHALVTRGAGYTTLLLVVTTGGGLVAEAVGVHTGRIFGSYRYAGSLGPRLLDVPVVVPLAWTMLAHPAACTAARLVSGPTVRALVAGWALASWDVFLDPQMVAAGHWRWTAVGTHLPGVPGVPVTNYAGWLAVALLMMAVLAPAAGHRRDQSVDGPAYALYLWTWGGSLLANLAFFERPAVALWGGLAMGLVAVPLALRLGRA